MNSETEGLLNELTNYIATSRKERGSMFEQLKGLGDATQRTFHQLELIEQKLQASIESLRNDFKGLSARITDLERDMVVTGNHDAAELRERLKKYEWDEEQGVVAKKLKSL